MKKVTLVLVAILFVVTAVFSQTPVMFKYQAVLRDASGSILANKEVVVDISLLQGSANGTSVFDETHNVTTTGQGLINLNIGSVEDLSVVNFSADNYFIKITVGGIEMGTSQLLSVPYALTAKRAESFNGTITKSQISDLGKCIEIEQDGDVTNEIQDLSLTGNILKITNNGAATEIDLSPYLENTTLTENQVDNFVSNNGYLTEEGDSSVTNEIQDLSLTNNILKITKNGTATEIDLNSYLDNTTLTENQVDNFVSNNGYLTSYTETDPSVPNGNQTGDMQYWNGSEWVTVPVGSEGQILTLSGGVPTWGNVIGLNTLGADQEFSVGENSNNGTSVGTIAVGGANTENLEFSIISSNVNGVFQINSSSGELTVLDNSKLDYEQHNYFKLVVNVRNKELGVSSNSIVKVNVTDVDETPQNGLVGRYTFNDSFSDLSSNALHATNNGATFVTGRADNAGKAIQLNGNGQYVSAPSSFDFQEKTISLWFNANDIPVYNYQSYPNSSWGAIVTCDNSQLQYGALKIAVSKVNGINKVWVYKHGMDGAFNPNLLTTEINESQWYNITLTMSQDKVKMYVNGVFINSYANATVHSVDGDIALNIGSSRNGSNRYFNGKIDDLLIYNRVLTDDEIRLIYSE